jgi:type II secretory pathway pseudopilin PulG
MGSQEELMQTKIFKKHNQSGQTLIETLVAAFVLTMGISAALGLATYALSATSNIKQRVIAVGLAREGIEAVKNIRDTNWLRGTLSTDCFNFEQQNNTANCYRDWLNPLAGNGYNIDTSGKTLTYNLEFNANESIFWKLQETDRNFGLDFSYEAMETGTYFTKGGITVTESNSGFGRAITLTPDNSFKPFDQDTGPRLKVTSEVWWSDKNCPISDTIPEDPACKIKLETYLTNWKTF